MPEPSRDWFHPTLLQTDPHVVVFVYAVVAMGHVSTHIMTKSANNTDDFILAHVEYSLPHHSHKKMEDCHYDQAYDKESFQLQFR